MSTRSIRRARERQLQKLASKQEKLAVSAAPANSHHDLSAELDWSPEPADCQNMPPISAARVAANRANAQLSTGPRTEEGKAISRLNAVKTGLTGRTVLLPSDDAASYEHHCAEYEREFQPVGLRECELVQSLANADWRLRRISALEMAIYARGRSEFSQKFDCEALACRPGLIELETFLVYEKQLRNLQLHESRLRRHREKDLAELRLTQRTRIAEEKAQLADAAALYNSAQEDGRAFDPAEHGFEFSVDDVEAYLEGARAARLLQASLKTGANQAIQRAQAAA